MKKTTLLYFFVIGYIGVKAQDTIYYDHTNRIVNSLQLANSYQIIIPDVSDYKNAGSKEYYKSGKLKSECNLINIAVGKINWVIDGVYKSWYESGVLQSEIEYSLGLINGKIKTYWPNGKLKRNEQFELLKSISGKCYNEKGEKIDFFPYMQSAIFKGGRDSIDSFIKRNVRPLTTDSAKVITGDVTLSFSIGVDGSVINPSIVKSSDDRLNQEAIRVISSLPKCKPAMLDGVPVVTSISQIVKFVNHEQNNDILVGDSEIMPQFIGGESALSIFIAKNLIYPFSAFEKKIQGKVIVRFVVSSTGQVSQLNVVRGIGGGCDEEALRVVKMLPKWIPGMKNGKPVDVWYTLPISFRLM